MKLQITNVQLACFLANVLYSISLVQEDIVIINPAGQNGWIVFFFMVPYIMILVFVSFFNQNNVWRVLASEKEEYHWSEKLLAFVFICFLMLLFIHDLLSFLLPTKQAILPQTPFLVIIVITLMVLVYLARLGLGTLAIYNQLVLPILLIFAGTIPFSVMKKIELLNFVPNLNFHTYPSILQAILNSLPWTGQIVIVFLMLGDMKPLKSIRLTAIVGAVIGLLNLYLLIFFKIAVMGEDLLRNQTTSTLALSRELRFVEVIFIFFVWITTVFSKLAIEVYCLYKCINILFKLRTTLTAYPAVIIPGIIILLFFQNNMDHYNFYLTDFSLGGTMLFITEVLIVLLFVVAANSKKRTQE